MKSIFDLVPFFVEDWKGRQGYLAHNEKLLDVYEGNLLQYVDEELKKQLSDKPYQQARQRICPINVLTKFVDKLSKIYQEEPTRTVVDGNEKDAELLSWYEKKTEVNKFLNIGNEYYNLAKGCLIEPYIHNRVPRLRIIKGDRFIVHGMDPVDPMRATHIVIEDGRTKDANGDTVVIFRAYSDTQFVMFTDKGDILRESMNAFDNPEGINPYGRLPFVWVNKSNSSIMPKQDSDTLWMTILIPLMLTDLNYISMFTAFAIVYLIDCDDENLTKAPSAIWTIKTDPNSEKKPQVGSIKPEADIQATLGLIQAEFSFWLNTKGIRPGQVGQLTPDNFLSGISKMIDEGDVTESRNEQVGDFKPAEAELWDLMLNHMHPVWAKQGLIENQHIFTPSASVQTNFAKQLPAMSRKDVIDEVKTEYESGFTSWKRVVKRLNPHMTDKEIDELREEINAERILRQRNQLSAAARVQ